MDSFLSAAPDVGGLFRHYGEVPFGGRARASDCDVRTSGSARHLLARPPCLLGRPRAGAPGASRRRGRPVVTARADVLSDVLRAVRLTGAVYFDFEMSSPWVAQTPDSREIASKVMPGADRVIHYHLVARGSCWGNALDQEPVRLSEGDLILFPKGDAHVLSSAPGMRAEPDMARFARPSTPLPLVYEMGGGGPDRVRLVCGFLGCDDRPFNPLLLALPPVIHLRGSGSDARTGWLGALHEVAVAESGRGRPGGENVLARLAELMFVEAIRRYLETLPAAQTGWLSGLRDAVVGQALAAVHAQPGEPWTVESLARAAGASRSVLAERFTEMVGQPPMQYLALWRMQLAARLLADGGAVAEVGRAVGYDSEAAFSRAFKKLVGQAPGTWRRGRRAFAAG
jgi:AraC-like DNA-binding protein